MHVSACQQYDISTICYHITCLNNWRRQYRFRILSVLRCFAKVQCNISPSFHPSIHPFIYIHPCFHPVMHTSIHTYTHPSNIHPSTYSAIHPSTHTSIHLYTNPHKSTQNTPLNPSSHHRSLYPFSQPKPPYHLPIHPSIHTYVYPYTLCVGGTYVLLIITFLFTLDR